MFELCFSGGLRGNGRKENTHAKPKTTDSTQYELGRKNYVEKKSDEGGAKLQRESTSRSRRYKYSHVEQCTEEVANHSENKFSSDNNCPLFCIPSHLSINVTGTLQDHDTAGKFVSMYLCSVF